MPARSFGLFQGMPSPAIHFWFKTRLIPINLLFPKERIMKAIKSLKKQFIYSLAFCFLVLSFTSCKKLFGLDRQTNTDHVVTTIDPHIHKTAWQYLKERANGNLDTIFKRTYDAVIYSEIDTNEYLKPNRTFIFLHNDAVYRKSGST